MNKAAKTASDDKNKEQIGVVDVFSEMFSGNGGAFKLPKKVFQHLKVLGFLAVWFAVPFFLLIVWFSSPQLLPEVYEATPQDSCTAAGGTWNDSFPSGCGDNCGTKDQMCTAVLTPGCNCGPGKCWDETSKKCIDGESAFNSDKPTYENYDINFVISFDGVIKKPVDNQPVFIKLVNNQDSSLNKVFNPISVWQDSGQANRFHGKMNLTTAYLRDGFTVYVKGPVHLQRKFDNVTFRQGMEADFTNKVLLPGDLYLPGSGQNDRVENSDRDYLWSLVVLHDRSANSSEVRAADLDLNGQVNNRDYSLLIDTGIGTKGEE